uniref:Uncharacterized protein n=1 Tax=Haplochromis burtoni TaxID=8153 RepID=A0A3Q2VLH1_HAPBU
MSFVLALVLSWTGLCSVLYIFSTGLVAVVALWTARLLLRYTWYSHRLSCFSKPQTRSWLVTHPLQNYHIIFCSDFQNFSAPHLLAATLSRRSNVSLSAIFIGYTDVFTCFQTAVI